MFGSGRKALTNVREWSRGAYRCSRVVAVGHPGCPGVVGRPSRMSRSGWEALPENREWSGGLPDVWEWLGGPPGCPRVVERPPGCLGVVGRLSQMFESGKEACRMSEGEVERLF